MENKAPKELWIGKADLKTIVDHEWVHDAGVWQYKVNESMTQYLHISEVERQLSKKQTEIDNLIKLVAERNADIAEKDKEIEELRNMCLPKCSYCNGTGNSGGVKNIGLMCSVCCGIGYINSENIIEKLRKHIDEIESELKRVNRVFTTRKQKGI